MVNRTLLFILIINLSLYADFYYSGGKKHFINKIKSIRMIDSDKEIYQTKNKTILGINNQLLISYKDIHKKKYIEQKYNLKFIKKLSSDIYLYAIDNQSKTLQIANAIYNEKGIKFSHPNFTIKKKSRWLTTDQYSYRAWHLRDDYYGNHSDINIEPAWRYTKGEGVKVAVYDKGIDIEHPDLKANIVGFENFNDPNSNIPYSDDPKQWHGTACAGIISALENRIGSVGVAPKSQLYAVGYSESAVSKDIEAYEWMMNQGISVINNSWGSYENLDAYNDVFKELATKGRNGKGILIVFAAGNENINLDDNGINDESESPYVISVAASTKDNIISSYSNYGSAVDFTAPGGDLGAGLFTTDAQGELGYADIDYTYKFIGTSAAAPVVSGTITLMLSANPNLTREEIIDILKDTADKIGNYAYDENGRNDHWGYGRINAGRAVKSAYYFGKSKLKNFAHTIFTEIN